MTDQHRWLVGFDGGYAPTLEVECPYDPVDPMRPCWPTEEDGTPLAPPQPDCNYREWLGASDVEDIVHGFMRVAVKVRVEYEHGSIRLHLEGPHARRSRPGRPWPAAPLHSLVRIEDASAALGRFERDGVLKLTAAEAGQVLAGLGQRFY